MSATSQPISTPEFLVNSGSRKTSPLSACVSRNHVIPASMPSSSSTAARPSNVAIRCGSASVSSTHHKNPLLYRRKVIRLLIAMVIAFGICMLPHHVRLQWQAWSDVSSYTRELMYIPPFTTLLFYINSCLNPFLYALISNKFRKSFRELRSNGRAPRERFTLDTGRH